MQVIVPPSKRLQHAYFNAVSYRIETGSNVYQFTAGLASPLPLDTSYCDLLKVITLFICFYNICTCIPTYTNSFLLLIVSTKRSRETSAMLHVLIFIFHIINTVVIVEPAHRSTQEVRFHLN